MSNLIGCAIYSKESKMSKEWNTNCKIYYLLNYFKARNQVRKYEYTKEPFFLYFLFINV